MFANTKERLLYFLTESGISKSQFYNDCDLKRGLLDSDKMKGSVSDTMIAKILVTYPRLNYKWLLLGEGDMYNDTPVNEVHRFEMKSSELIDPRGEIILYDLEASANLKSLLINKDQNILGKISIPNIPRCDGAVYVKGDSMYPLLKSGDIVAYKEITLDMQHIIFGEMYLVSIDMDGDEYLAVKYVQPSKKGDEWIQLVSYNSYHQPKDFPLSAVRAMALVKLSIRMNTMK